METSALVIPRTTCLSAMQLEKIRAEWPNKNREALDQVLEGMEVRSVSNKINALLSAMGIGENDKVFYSGSCEVAGDSNYDEEKDQFEAIIGAFFTGAWR